METLWEFRSAGKPVRRNEDEARGKLYGVDAWRYVAPKIGAPKGGADAIAGLSVPPNDLFIDLNGDSTFRAYLTRVLCARAVARPGEPRPFQ